MLDLGVATRSALSWMDGDQTGNGGQATRFGQRAQNQSSESFPVAIAGGRGGVATEYLSYRGVRALRGRSPAEWLSPEATELGLVMSG